MYFSKFTWDKYIQRISHFSTGRAMSKINIKWLIAGAAFGYFVLHPLVHVISLAHFFGEQGVATDFFSDIPSAFSPSMLPWSIAFMILSALIGVSWGKIKQADEEKSKIIKELQKALDKVKTLSGMLPICASCKKIRDDKGYWNKIEAYIEKHSEAEFSHGICPECAKELYPEYFSD
jgi:hypothetical protein